MSQLPNDKRTLNAQQAAKADAKRIQDIAFLLSRVMVYKATQEIEQLTRDIKGDATIDVTKRHD